LVVRANIPFVNLSNLKFNLTISALAKMKQIPLLSIKQVCSQTGLPSSTLRFWEKEFRGLLIPLRTNGGQRRYDQEALVLIREIKKLRDQGVNLGAIRQTLIVTQDHLNSLKIEFLANRVAEVVKSEIYHYFYNQERS
jgi:DNA-binding transcriptional MerR regulator